MEYQIIYSKRRTLCIEITKDARVIVRSPMRCTKAQIEAFVTEHKHWIEKKLPIAEEKLKNRVEYTPAQIEEMRSRAKRIIPPRVEYFAHKFSLYPTSIKITSAKTRHGSCSGKNGLCFSLYLMSESDEFIDHVILHELAHIKHKNHSKAFHAFLHELEATCRTDNTTQTLPNNNVR